MADIEALKDEALEGAAGGATNTTDWRGAHWQPQDHAMGTTWTDHGWNWYRVKPGDTLGAIAQRFGYTVDRLAALNPKTITNKNMIYAGDALVLGEGHL